MVILSFGQYFSQLGVGRALVQRNEITDVDIRVAFTSSTLLGVGFTVVFWFARAAGDAALSRRPRSCRSCAR